MAIPPVTHKHTVNVNQGSFLPVETNDVLKPGDIGFSFKKAGGGSAPLSLLDILNQMIQQYKANPATFNPANFLKDFLAKLTGANDTGGTGADGKSVGPVKLGSGASSLSQAAANTHVKFMPILRGDEAAQDKKITDQASFGREVDKVAKEYGLDPNEFRAQLQAESGAMTDYKKAMRHNGDTNRGSNSSVGIGQISRNFLNGGPWSHGGPNDRRVGGKTVTSAEYNNSALIQLRVAAGNLAMRIQDHGGGKLDGGLRYYVSGHASADSQNQIYIDNINKFMRDKNLMNIGRS